MSAFRMARLNPPKKPKSQKLKVKESEIQKAILEFLTLKKIFVWVSKTTGTFDPTRKVFRKNAQMMKGVADILGIFNRTPFCIEVKSETGRLSPDQKIFLDRFKAEGGIAIVARSVDDVNRALREIADAKTRDHLDQI